MYPNGPQPAAPSSGNAWKLGAICGIMVLGGVFGTVVAVTVFGLGGSAAGTAQVSRTPDNTKSSFQQSFDASFKSSCRMSAMRMGNISKTSADNYCDCALSAFNQTHSMTKAVASCKQYIIMR